MGVLNTGVCVHGPQSKEHSHPLCEVYHTVDAVRYTAVVFMGILLIVEECITYENDVIQYHVDKEFCYGRKVNCI